MNEIIKLTGCLVIAVGWVALPLSLPLWAESEYHDFTWIIMILTACEVGFFTWVLYYKF